MLLVISALSSRARIGFGTKQVHAYSSTCKGLHRPAVTWSPGSVYKLPVRHSSIMLWQHLNYCGLDAQMTEAMCIDPSPFLLSSPCFGKPFHPLRQPAIFKRTSHSSNIFVWFFHALWPPSIPLSFEPLIRMHVLLAPLKAGVHDYIHFLRWIRWPPRLLSGSPNLTFIFFKRGRRHLSYNRPFPSATLFHVAGGLLASLPLVVPSAVKKIKI